MNRKQSSDKEKIKEKIMIAEKNRIKNTASPEVVEMKKGLKTMKILTITFACVTIIAGVVLTGLILDHILKGTTGGELEISEHKVDSLMTFLGVEALAITDNIASQLDVNADSGVFIANVDDDSPAAAGGLQRGDVIVRYNDQAVLSLQQFQNLVAETEPGDVVKIVVSRNGMSRNLFVETGAVSISDLTTVAGNMPVDSSAQGKGAQLRNTQSSNDGSNGGSSSITPDQEMDMIRAPLLHTGGDEADDDWGISVSPITPDIVKRYNLDDKDGVVVAEVITGGISDIAGLSIGDLIMGVNGTDTPDMKSFYDAIADKQELLLDVYSDGKEEFIILNVDPDSLPASTVGIPVSAVLNTADSKIAVTALGPELNSQMSYLFMSTPYFLIINPEDFSLIKAIPSTVNTAYSGYGIQAAQICINEEVEAVITGDIGIQAFDALTLSGINVYKVNNPALSALEALKLYNQGQLTELNGATVVGSGYARNFASQASRTAATLTQGGPPNLSASSSASVPLNYTYVQGSLKQSQVDTCVCPVCGYEMPHQIGIPCYTVQCPNCGSIMIRSDKDISLTGGKPENIPPIGGPDDNSQSSVGNASIGRSVTYMPVQQTGGTTSGGKPVQYVPVQQTGGTTSGGKPVEYIPSKQTSGTQTNAVPTVASATDTAIPGQMSINIRVPFQSRGQENIQVETSQDIPAAAANSGGSQTGGTAASLTSDTVSDSDTSTCVDICVCPECGFELQHAEDAEIPCNSILCPECGTPMVNAEKSITLTGGSSSDSEDDEDEDGFQGRPLKIPVQGKRENVEAELQDSVDIQITIPNTDALTRTASPQSIFPGLALPGDKGSAANSYPVLNKIALTQNQAQILPQPQDLSVLSKTGTCYCPNCDIVLSRPAGTACSSLTCPYCGGRLVNTSSGNSSGAGNSPANSGISQTLQLPQTYSVSTIGVLPQSSAGSGNNPINRANVIPQSQYTVVQELPQAVLPQPGISNGTGGASVQNNLQSRQMPGSYIIVSDTAKTDSTLTADITAPSVAVASSGKKLTSDIAPFFDNAPYFIVFKYGNYDVLSNPNSKDTTGSGSQTAQWLVGKGVGVVICNNISVDALSALRGLRVAVYSKVSGTVQEAISWYQTGMLDATVAEDDKTSDDAEHDSSASRGKGPREDKARGESVTTASF